MRGLAEDRSIVIKLADKGSCVVVWDKLDYLAEAENHLNDSSTYQDAKFGDDDLVKLVEQSNKMFQKLLSKQNISSSEYKYFCYNYKRAANLGKMYLLPKIHKRLENVPGRPVISNYGTPTEKASEFLDHHLKPIMQSAKSYIKDTSDFLRKLKGLGKVPENAILVTADVVGLYPSIPHEDDLEALYTKLEEQEDKRIATEDILQMAKFVLKNNFFEFNSKIKHEISGTAIGTKFAPPYACIFMDKLETDFLDKENLKPWVWLRYIDDIFFVWTHGEELLHDLLKRLNEFHPSLKFTYEYSKQQINFLDVVVGKGDKFVTDLYCKATDCHQYVHCNSCHPDHMKKSSIYSQGLRIKRLCSDHQKLQTHLQNLKKRFCERGYPGGIIDEQLQRMKGKSREELLRAKGTERQNVGIPFVVTYHPHLKNISKIIKKHANYLQIDPEVRSLFTSLPFVSFRSVRNLRSHLVRSKLYPEERAIGSAKCNSPRCLTCNDVKECDTFTSHVTKETFKINHRFDCNSKCLIYLLSCKVCGKQYVGSTTDRFRFRWNNYKNCQRKAERGEDHMQKYLHDHFLGEDHDGLVHNVVITFIDKTDPSDPERREEFWRTKLRTLAPHGLNNEE